MKSNRLLDEITEKLAERKVMKAALVELAEALDEDDNGGVKIAVTANLPDGYYRALNAISNCREIGEQLRPEPTE